MRTEHYYAVEMDGWRKRLTVRHTPDARWPHARIRVGYEINGNDTEIGLMTREAASELRAALAAILDGDGADDAGGAA